ncbi:hypothetical protein IWX90DRAFT_13410 [Phyllosticta citrichinensis]|uniref:Uncharacterized protein n=1 Tax=Phyllosticta citrichinensis TaxID=1130410 RepID=A0ABR1Y6A2_9PEZI
MHLENSRVQAHFSLAAWDAVGTPVCTLTLQGLGTVRRWLENVLDVPPPSLCFFHSSSLKTCPSKMVCMTPSPPASRSTCRALVSIFDRRPASSTMTSIPMVKSPESPFSVFPLDISLHAEHMSPLALDRSPHHRRWNQTNIETSRPFALESTPPGFRSSAGLLGLLRPAPMKSVPLQSHWSDTSSEGSFHESLRDHRPESYSPSLEHRDTSLFHRRRRASGIASTNRLPTLEESKECGKPNKNLADFRPPAINRFILSPSPVSDCTSIASTPTAKFRPSMENVALHKRQMSCANPSGHNTMSNMEIGMATSADGPASGDVVDEWVSTLTTEVDESFEF